MDNSTVISLCFRDAILNDIDAIVALVESAYRGDSSRMGWTTEANFLEGQRTDAQAVAALITTADSRILLCERNNELLACAHIQKQTSISHFGMFSVHPALQSGGIGKALLAKAEGLARDQWKCVAMHMKVITIRTELIDWYKRRGYNRTGKYEPFPYGDAHFGIPKRNDLCFEILEKVLA